MVTGFGGSNIFGGTRNFGGLTPRIGVPNPNTQGIGFIPDIGVGSGLIPPQPPAPAPIPAPATNPIVAPQAPSIIQGTQDIKDAGLIPEFKAFNFDPITAQTVDPITNQLGPDFFRSLENEAVKRLESKTFGDTNSAQNRLTNLLNRRGQIGSGIETGANLDLQQQFGDDLVSIQDRVLQAQAKAAQDVAFKNAGIDQFNIGEANRVAEVNARESLAAEQKNRAFEGLLSELGLKGGADQATTTSDFEKDIFDSIVGLESDKFKSENQVRSDALGITGDQLGNELLSTDFRDFLQDLLGSNLKSALR